MAAVAETGNRTLAAERAKVSQSWVTLHRATDPAFRAELDAAVASAKASLGKLGTGGGTAGSGASRMLPAPGWRSAGGEELVVRAGNGRRTQIARARLKQWTPRVEARFLAALAGCCNVKAACAAVGLTQASAYNHRKRWAGFGQRWDEALAIGYERVEGAMLAAAHAMFDPAAEECAVEPDLPVAGMTVDAAMQVLWLHQRQVRGSGKAPGALPQQRSRTESVEAALRRAIDDFDRAEARKAVHAKADAGAIADGAAAVRGSRRQGGGG